MTTSKAPPRPPQGAAPAAAGTPAAPQGPGNSYTRFIPREELGSFAAWNPGALEEPGARRPAPGESPAGGGVHKAPFAVRAGVAAGVPAEAARPRPAMPADSAFADLGRTPGPRGPAAAAAAPEVAPEPPAPPEPAPDVDALVREARQAGYQDGYRDGLAALESVKQSHAAQMAAFMSDQVGALIGEMQQRLDTVEQQLSGRIAGVALELARQVVRSEITLRPDVVVAVAEEALNTLLASARQVTLRLHPEDQALVKGVIDEQLAARGGRAVPDPHLTRGGCVIESDIAVVDASVEARWHTAAAAMGLRLEWDEHPRVPMANSPVSDEGDSAWLDDMAPADPATGADR